MKRDILLCITIILMHIPSYGFWEKDWITKHVLTQRVHTFLADNKNSFQKTLGPVSATCLVKLAQHLWSVECDQKIDNLTFWSAKENFPSFGIGHFTWFPKQVKSTEPFVESFPNFLAFAKKFNQSFDKVLVLDQECTCPWSSRQLFYDQFNTSLLALRTFLIDTIDLQICFIVHSFHERLLKKIGELPQEHALHAQKQIKRMVSSPKGLFMLIDYASFKGLDDDIEQYNSYGWGLFSLLKEMRGYRNGCAAVKEFVQAGMLVLKRRVDNAPSDRPEQMFLAGWNNRLQSYLL